jgi:hypothetical protein
VTPTPDDVLEELVSKHKESPSFPTDDEWPPMPRFLTFTGDQIAAMAEELLLRRRAMRAVADKACLGPGQMVPAGQEDTLKVNDLRRVIYDGHLRLQRDGYEP